MWHSADDGERPDWLRRALRRARQQELDERFDGGASPSPLNTSVSCAPSVAADTVSAPSAAGPSTISPEADDGTTRDDGASNVNGSESILTLDNMADDVILAMARCVLEADTRAAMRLTATSMAMYEKLRDIRDAAQQQRMLRWLPEWTALHRIEADGRTLTAEGENDGETMYVSPSDTVCSWAAGNTLPSTGVSAWTIRINTSRSGRQILGVCDHAGTCGWGLEPYSGLLRRHTRAPSGEVHLFTPGPPPCGCPDGGGVRLMAANLRDPSKAEGTIIEFELDADNGTLYFTVDELGRGREYPKAHVSHPRARVLRGFPRGVSLRPWAMLYLHVGDQVRLSGYVE